MILFLLLGIPAVYFLLALFGFAGFLGLAIGYYILGFLWYRIFILTRPVSERPLGSPILLITMWPITALVLMYEHIQLVTGPERYEVFHYPNVIPISEESESDISNKSFVSSDAKNRIKLFLLRAFLRPKTCFRDHPATAALYSTSRVSSVHAINLLQSLKYDTTRSADTMSFEQCRIESNFDSFDDALIFAKKKASESDHFVYITDTARYITDPSTGEPDYKMYIALPSGEVIRAL